MKIIYRVTDTGLEKVEVSTQEQFDEIMNNEAAFATKQEAMEFALDVLCSRVTEIENKIFMEKVYPIDYSNNPIVANPYS